MSKWELTSFSDPQLHTRVKDIIMKYSTNGMDVRDVALDELELGGKKDVLDLGCGFGFMSEKISGALPPGSSITGMDALGENEIPFSKLMNSLNREFSFIQHEIIYDLPFQAEKFDLVISSFSLYFFPNIIPDVGSLKRMAFFLLSHTASGLSPDSTELLV